MIRAAQNQAQIHNFYSVYSILNFTQPTQRAIDGNLVFYGNDIGKYKNIKEIDRNRSIYSYLVALSPLGAVFYILLKGQDQLIFLNVQVHSNLKLTHHHDHAHDLSGSIPTHINMINTNWGVFIYKRLIFNRQV